jgi:polar amino acid transport system permease protein
MDVRFVIEILPALGRGALLSLAITVASFALAAALGVVLMVGRKSRQRAFSVSTAAFIDFMRSTPLLVHIYALFFMLPEFGVIMSPLATGILAIALHNGCYLAEIYRSSWDAVPRGQWEAAKALGLSRFVTVRLVIVPQLLPRLVPDMGNFLIYSFKDSPLLGAIAVAEIMYVANGVASERFRYFEPITLVGLFLLRACE